MFVGDNLTVCDVLEFSLKEVAPQLVGFKFAFLEVLKEVVGSLLVRILRVFVGAL